jgi:septum site-determining protein MinC
MVTETVSSQAFKLKGRLYTLTVVHMLNADKNLFKEQVLKAVKTAPRLFEATPVILDCSFLADENFDLVWTCACLKKHGMLVIAVQSALPEHIALAAKIGLPVLSSSSTQDKNFVAEESKEEAKSHEARLHNTPVRSGQQIASPYGDLIITSAVSYGAELLAAGNIHVYGALRGRALAGINGNKDVRIFCQSLDAELVSIAGVYCLSDAIRAINYPCQIFLQNERIQVAALC